MKTIIFVICSFILGWTLRAIWDYLKMEVIEECKFKDKFF